MKEITTKTLAKDKLEFVSSILTNKEGDIIFFRRRKDLELDPGKFDFCSGHIKEGEIPMQAMYREIKEEIGLEPEQIKLEKIGVIGTPHEDFEDTLTYVYHTQICIDIDGFVLNDMIRNVEKPEFDDLLHFKNIESLEDYLSKKDNNFRMQYTKQLKYALEAVKQRMNKTNEEREEDLCEEK